MTAVVFEGESYEVAEGETVLDALLKAGQEVNYGCQSGVCQSCMMQCDEGELPPASQKGLQQKHASLNYFLACQCRPNEVICVADINKEKIAIAGEVLSKTMLNPSVVQLLVKTPMAYRAGQYVTLWKDAQLGRSYSVASASSTSEDAILEFHIKLIEAGEFSGWLKEECEPGAILQVQGPMGTCFYQGNVEQSILLAGIGTGLAPLLGVLRDALAEGHQGQIDLVLGAKTSERFYLVEELNALAKVHDNLCLHWVSQEDETGSESADQQEVIGDIYRFIKTRFDDWSNKEVYLCGAETFVKKLKKQVFLDGVAMSAIYSDCFVAS